MIKMTEPKEVIVKDWDEKYILLDNNKPLLISHSLAEIEIWLDKTIKNQFRMMAERVESFKSKIKEEFAKQYSTMTSYYITEEVKYTIVKCCEKL